MQDSIMQISLCSMVYKKFSISVSCISICLTLCLYVSLRLYLTFWHQAEKELAADPSIKFSFIVIHYFIVFFMGFYLVSCDLFIMQHI